MKIERKRIVLNNNGVWPSRFTACCPFHYERTPSLIGKDYRHDDVKGKGDWSCLGCGRHGYWIVGESLDTGQEIFLQEIIDKKTLLRNKQQVNANRS